MSQVLPSIIHSWKRLKPNTVILDTETTGIDDLAEICEISLVDGNGNVLFDSVINPLNDIPEKAIAIHGITNEEAEHAPSFAEIYHKIYNLCHKRTVVTYNAKFDLRLLDQSCRAHDMIPVSEWDCEWLCAMESYADFAQVVKVDKYGNKSFKWHKLADAAKQLGIEVPENLHRALPDTKLTLAVIKGAYQTLIEREKAATAQEAVTESNPQSFGEIA